MNIKNFNQFINENVNISYPSVGKKVVFMPGRFQPFHIGHLTALKKASNLFQVPVVPIQVISQKEESPFPTELLLEIGNEIVKHENYIDNFFIYPRGYGKTVIPWFVRFLRDQGYEAIGVAAGSDRINDYASQVKYIKSDKTDTKVVNDFELKEVDTRIQYGPSGTKVRQALLDDNLAAFKKLMPQYLHRYYPELKKYV